MQIKYGRGTRIGMLPVPGTDMVTVGQRQVEDLGAFGRLTPPALRVFYGKDLLALPFIQLGVPRHAGNTKEAGGQPMFGATEHAFTGHGKSISLAGTTYTSGLNRRVHTTRPATA